jgi:hypothetical protein
MTTDYDRHPENVAIKAGDPIDDDKRVLLAREFARLDQNRNELYADRTRLNAAIEQCEDAHARCKRDLLDALGVLPTEQKAADPYEHLPKSTVHVGLT